MIKLRLIFLFTLGYFSSIAQNYTIDANGKQREGSALVDTLADTHKAYHLPSKQALIFRKINPDKDSITITGKTISLPVLNNGNVKDSSDYFILFNAGKSAVRFFLLNGRLGSLKEVSTKKDDWKPIEYVHRVAPPGVSLDKKTLLSGAYLIIRTTKHSGSASCKQRLRLKTESNGVLVSEPFAASFDPEELSLGPEFSKYRFMLKEYISYLYD